MLGTIRQHAKWFANGAATKKMYLTVSHTEDAVSYTHLDVYKRQALNCYASVDGMAVSADSVLCIGTVSYTHLDVYKRQVHKLRLDIS